MSIAAAAIIAGWPLQQLQCVGCDRNFLWYSVGLPLVSLVRVGLCWSCWYSPKSINVLECEPVRSEEVRGLRGTSELTPPTFAGLEIFSMRGTLQPDRLGELLQRRRQNGTPGTGGRVTTGLVDAAQPFGSLFHPMPRWPAKHCHH